MAIALIELTRSLILERFYSLNIFNAIPTGKSDFRPKRGMRTVAEQLSHIGAFDEWLVQGLKHKNWAFDIFTDRPEKTVEEALAYMEYNRKRLMDMIEELQDEGLAKEVGPAPGFPPQMSVSNVIFTTLSHECHHRGQLVVYLRMMGIVPPLLNAPA